MDLSDECATSMTAGRAACMLKPKGKRIFAKVWENREGTRKRMEALFTRPKRTSWYIFSIESTRKSLGRKVAGNGADVTVPDGVVNEV